MWCAARVFCSLTCLCVFFLHDITDLLSLISGGDCMAIITEQLGHNNHNIIIPEIGRMDF